MPNPIPHQYLPRNNQHHYQIDAGTFAKMRAYQAALGNGEKQPGKRLAAEIEHFVASVLAVEGEHPSAKARDFIATYRAAADDDDDDAKQQAINQFIADLPPADFMQLLMNTRQPAISAEAVADIKEGGRWTVDEYEILGNVGSIVKEVTVYDTGLWEREKPQENLGTVYLGEEPYQADMLCIPGLILKWGPDHEQMIRLGQLDKEQFKQAYKDKLTHLFQLANDRAQEKGTKAFISLPGIGDGAFAGAHLRGKLVAPLAAAIEEILQENAAQWQHIGWVVLDGYTNQEEENEIIQGNEAHSIRFAVKNFGGKNPGQQSKPAEFAEHLTDDPGEQAAIAVSHKLKVFAWDPFSFEGNDWVGGKRTTDEANAAACDMLRVIFGIDGVYNPELGYCPPEPFVTWSELFVYMQVKQPVFDRLQVMNADGTFAQLESDGNLFSVNNELVNLVNQGTFGDYKRALNALPKIDTVTVHFAEIVLQLEQHSELAYKETPVGKKMLLLAIAAEWEAQPELSLNDVLNTLQAESQKIERFRPLCENDTPLRYYSDSIPDSNFIKQHLTNIIVRLEQLQLPSEVAAVSMADDDLVMVADDDSSAQNTEEANAIAIRKKLLEIVGSLALEEGATVASVFEKIEKVKNNFPEFIEYFLNNDRALDVEIRKAKRVFQTLLVLAEGGHYEEQAKDAGFIQRVFSLNLNASDLESCEQHCDGWSSNYDSEWRDPLFELYVKVKIAAEGLAGEENSSDAQELISLFEYFKNTEQHDSIFQLVGRLQKTGVGLKYSMGLVKDILSEYSEDGDKARLFHVLSHLNSMTINFSSRVEAAFFCGLARDFTLITALQSPDNLEALDAIFAKLKKQYCTPFLKLDEVYSAAEALKTDASFITSEEKGIADNLSNRLVSHTDGYINNMAKFIIPTNITNGQVPSLTKSQTEEMQRNLKEYHNNCAQQLQQAEATMVNRHHVLQNVALIISGVVAAILALPTLIGTVVISYYTGRKALGWYKGTEVVADFGQKEQASLRGLGRKVTEAHGEINEKVDEASKEDAAERQHPSDGSSSEDDGAEEENAARLKGPGSGS